MHGKEINLTADTTTITSTNFSVDKDGNMTCNNADIKGAIKSGSTIEGSNITGSSITTPKFTVDSNGNMSCTNATITDGTLNISSSLENPQLTIRGRNYNADLVTNIYGLGITADVSGNTSIPLARLGVSNYNSALIGELTIANYGGSSQTDITPYGIVTPTVTQTSIENDKKNFELLKNALDIVKKTEIYKYNLKIQNDNDKKHIGFVIGKNYKYANEITSEIEGKQVGVDVYAMVSVLWKAVQEQQEQIEQLQKEIKELKEGK